MPRWRTVRRSGRHGPARSPSTRSSHGSTVQVGSTPGWAHVPVGLCAGRRRPPHEFADAVASVKMLLDAAVSRPQNPTRRARRIRSESRRRRWKDTPPRCCSRALLDATHWWSTLTDTADSSGRCSAPSATMSCPTRGAPWWSSPPRSGRRRAEQSRQIMSVSCPGTLA